MQSTTDSNLRYRLARMRLPGIGSPWRDRQRHLRWDNHSCGCVHSSELTPTPSVATPLSEPPGMCASGHRRPGVHIPIQNTGAKLATLLPLERMLSFSAMYACEWADTHTYTRTHVCTSVHSKGMNTLFSGGSVSLSMKNRPSLF